MELHTLKLLVESQLHFHSGGSQIQVIASHCPHFPKARDMATSIWDDIEMLMNVIHHQTSEMILEYEGEMREGVFCFSRKKRNSISGHKMESTTTELD